MGYIQCHQHAIQYVPLSHSSSFSHSSISYIDHDSFINGAPYNTFCRLRKEDPVSWCDGGNHKGFWSITRHEDIMLLNRDFRRVSSAQGIRLEDQTYEEYLARRTFQETDPPEHSRTRMLVAKAFSRPVVAQFEADIQQLCDQILDEALQSSEVDAVKKIARQLPMRMLGRIIGVPDQDLDWLVEKGDALIANTDQADADVDDVVGGVDVDADIDVDIDTEGCDGGSGCGGDATEAEIGPL